MFGLGGRWDHTILPIHDETRPDVSATPNPHPEDRREYSSRSSRGTEAILSKHGMIDRS